MATEDTGRRGDGCIRLRVDEPDRCGKRQKVVQKVKAVRQDGYMETRVCSVCQGDPVSTWHGWDNKAEPAFYCLQCWDEFFTEQLAALSNATRDCLEGAPGSVADLPAALRELAISRTGGSSSSSRGQSSPVLPRGTASIRHPANPSLTPIEEVLEHEPMIVFPSPGLQASMRHQ